MDGIYFTRFATSTETDKGGEVSEILQISGGLCKSYSMCYVKLSVIVEFPDWI